MRRADDRRGLTLQRAGRRWIVGGHWAAALLVSAGAVAWVRLAVVPSFNTTETLARGVEHARSTHTPLPSLARRVLVIVVDGLGYDHAASLPELEPLRREGAFRKLLADFPTFTAPALTSMVVGMGPRDSGVRLNGVGRGVAGLDSILVSAWDAGVFVRVRPRGFSPFADLVRPPAQADVVSGRWAVVADLAQLPALEAPTHEGRRAIEMEWVHLGEVDDAGHECGASCEAYGRAAAHAGDMVRAMAARLEPERDLLLVVSDHGTLASGGHGGDERGLTHAFALAWGARVKRGVELDPRPLRDVPSTLAVAAGVHSPSSNLGEPMLDLWELPEREAAARLVEPFDQTMAFGCRLRSVRACAYVDDVREALGSGKAGPDEAGALYAAVVWDRDRTLEAAEAGAQRRRAIGAAIGAGAAGAAIARWLRGVAWPDRAAGLLAPLPGAIAYGSVLFLLGYRPTLSAMAGEAVFVPHAAIAAGVGLAVHVAAARALGWWRAEAGFTIAVAVVSFAVIAATAGADPRALPSPLVSVLVIQAAPLVLAWALGAALSATFRTGTAGRSRPSSATTTPSAGRSESGCSDEDGCSRSRTGSPPA